MLGRYQGDVGHFARNFTKRIISLYGYLHLLMRGQLDGPSS